MKRELLYHYFSDDDFLRITNKIKETEKITSGEIRVSIKEERPFKKRKIETEELAKEEFYKLGMDKTVDKTGILIFILLKEKKFHILADAGINEKVNQSAWDKIRDEMTAYFQEGKFTRGITETIEKAGKILGGHFPIKAGDTNELTNKVAF